MNDGSVAFQAAGEGEIPFNYENTAECDARVPIRITVKVQRHDPPASTEANFLIDLEPDGSDMTRPRIMPISEAPVNLGVVIYGASLAAMMTPCLGSGRSSRRIERPAANAVLTTVVDMWGHSWPPRCPSESSGLLRWPEVDSRGPGNSPENGRPIDRASPRCTSRRVTK